MLFTEIEQERKKYVYHDKLRRETYRKAITNTNHIRQLKEC